MNRTIPHALGFIAEWPDSYGVAFYSPAHIHSPGDDVPCSASWLMIL